MNRLSESSTSCYLDSSSDPCGFISQNCNPLYFWIASRYYCHDKPPSNHTPSVEFLTLLVFLTYIILVLLFLITVFSSLSILTARYLFPIIRMFCHDLHLSEQILSCVMVPFVNCFPDLVSYHVAMRLLLVELALGQVMGQSLVLFTVVLGLISTVAPFAMDTSLKNDFAGVLVVVLVALYILWDGKLTIWECLFMVLMYICYLVYLYLTHSDDLHSLPPPTDITLSAVPEIIEPSNDSSMVYNNPLPVPVLEITAPNGLTRLHESLVRTPFDIEDVLSEISIEIDSSSQQNDDIESYLPPILPGSELSQPLIDPDQTILYNSTSNSFSDFNQTSLFDHLDNHIGKQPTRVYLDEDLSCHSISLGLYKHDHRTLQVLLTLYRPHRRALLYVTRPIQVFFNLIDLGFYLVVPFNHHDEQIGHVKSFWISWRNHQQVVSKYVRPLQVIFVPALVLHLTDSVYLTGFLFAWLFADNLASLPRIMTNLIPMGTTLLLTGSSAEMVLQVVKNLGVILMIPDSVLGITVFAITNSVNDIITDVTLATIGQPVLGANACLGTPFFLVLLGIGANGLAICWNTHSDINFTIDQHLKGTMFGAIGVLTFLLLYMPLVNWKFSKLLGGFLIFLWVAISAWTILSPI